MHRKWYVSGKRREMKSCQAIHIGLRYSRMETLSRRFFSHARMNHAKMNQRPPSPSERLCGLAGQELSGLLALACALVFCCGTPACARRIGSKTGTGLGVEKVRLAVADFKPSSSDPQNDALLKTFNDTLWNDLDVSGVVELVSKSFYPLQVPGQPVDVNFPAWSAPPPNAAMLAFGSFGVAGGKLTVQGWLYDVKNTASPQVLGKQYTDTPSDDAARVIAHKFADEIILRLGGGIAGHRRK